jgi:elongation factor 2
MPGNPLEEGNKVFDIIKEVRVRKGLAPDIPGIDKYYDKL